MFTINVNHPIGLREFTTRAQAVAMAEAWEIDTALITPPDEEEAPRVPSP